MHAWKKAFRGLRTSNPGHPVSLNTDVNSLSNTFFCVSANPAIDKRVLVPKLEPGAVNRASEVHSAPGGKTAHVAMVLRTLGADPLWIGTAGGRTGEELIDGLNALGIRAQPLKVATETRVNLEIIDKQGGVTELLEPGSALQGKASKDFLSACEKLFSTETKGSIVIASGSLPLGTEQNFYAELTELAHRAGHRMFLDTSGEPLRAALGSHPDFIKPNRSETETLTGKQIVDRASAQKSAEELILLGAQSVVISLGHDGLLWHRGTGQGVYHAQPEEVKARSTVGCGDATVAAFAYAAAMNFGVDDTLRLAAACGAANCLADSPGRLNKKEIHRFEPGIRVERVA
jgi:1-phosphofructokinase family hexose kinase